MLVGKYKKIIHHFLIWIALLSKATISFASCFNASPTDSYLSSSTIYGYVKNEFSNIYYSCAITADGKINISNNSSNPALSANISAIPQSFNSLPFPNFQIPSLSTFSIQTLTTLNGVILILI